jgi:hypothetical protein
MKSLRCHNMLPSLHCWNSVWAFSQYLPILALLRAQSFIHTHSKSTDNLTGHKVIRNGTKGILRIFINNANSVIQTFFWDANDYSAYQEILHLLWNLNVHYHFHNSLPLGPFLNQINPLYTSYPISLRTTFTSSSNLCLSLTIGIKLPSNFQIKNVYMYLFNLSHTCHFLQLISFSLIWHLQ